MVASVASLLHHLTPVSCRVVSPKFSSAPSLCHSASSFMTVPTSCAYHVYASWTPTCAFDVVEHANCSYVYTLSQCVCFFVLVFCSFNYFSDGCVDPRCCHHALSPFALIQIPFLCTPLPALSLLSCLSTRSVASFYDFLLRFVCLSDAAANVNPPPPRVK